MSRSARKLRQYRGGSNPAMDYIATCTSRDGARKALRFGFDAARFADGMFGDELDILRALADEFGDELPSGWIHRRIGELEAQA